MICLYENNDEQRKINMLKLLFIEDVRQSIEPILFLIESKNPEMCFEVSDFDAAKEKIASFQPDIVILDLMDDGGSAEPNPEGLNIHDFIWDQRFCPIVVYSARTDILEEEREDHPFVKCIKKGTGSDQAVLNELYKLRPHVEALKQAEEVVRNSFSTAMRDVAPYASKVFADDPQRFEETIKRSGRRRVAALMDEPLPDGKALAAWEQYLYPPISEHILLGDILKKSNGNKEDPTSFRVVLTPSCDMAVSNARAPKVSDILVAKCCSMKDGLNRMGLNANDPKIKERLRIVLSEGYTRAIIPLPALEEQIPTMAANLRDLELIPIDNISTEFLRIASLDSPFRELIAWGYQQTACRPGLPDRNFDSWCAEITKKLNG